MKSKKIFLFIYILLLSFIFVTIPVKGIDNYYIEYGPSVPIKVIDKNPSFDETRISNIKDPEIKLEELNKLNYDEVKHWTRFNSGEFGLVTPPDNQGLYNTCWSHAVSNASEISLLRSGKVMQTDAKKLKLSANSIAYSTANKNTEDDPLHNSYNDLLKEEWNQGHFISEASSKLTQWVAPALSTGKTDEHTKGKVNPDYYVKDVIKIDSKDESAIKKAIVEYGAVTMNYRTDIKHDDFYNAHNIDDWYNKNPKNVNLGQHAITIFGWDDTVSKDNFSYNKPKNNGAWLTKNSWGKSHGTNGTQYISYESDIDEVYAYTYYEADSNLHNYYYDGIIEKKIEPNYLTKLRKPITVAAVYEAKMGSSTKDEYLESVNISLNGTDILVNVEVYKDVKVNMGDKLDERNDPLNGEKIEEATTNVSFWTGGYREITLKNPVKLEPNEIYSVVVTVSSDKEVGVGISKEENSYNDQTYYINEFGEFKNSAYYDNGVVRLKAHTKTVLTNPSSNIKDLRNASISLINNKYVYKGLSDKTRFFKPVVKVDGEVLLENKDYILTYQEYKSYNTNKEIKGRCTGYIEIIITGINDYLGTANHFYIYLNELDSPFSSSFYIKNNHLTFKANKNNKVVRDLDLPDGFKITDYEYTSLEEKIGYNLKYDGEDNYKYRALESKLFIEFPAENDIDIGNIDLDISGLFHSYSYNGSEILPDLIIKNNNLILRPYQDYLLEYKDNINTGVGKIIIRGIGKYCGVKEVKFNIIQNKDNYISNLNIINNRGYGISSFGKVEFNYYLDSYFNPAVDTLIKGNTYYLRAYVLGNENYSGVISTEELKLYYQGIDNDPVISKIFSLRNINLSNDSFIYNALEQVPIIDIIVDNKKLVLNEDYKIEYLNNDFINVGEKQIKIIGLNNYQKSGVINLKYKITKATNVIYEFSYENKEFTVKSKYGDDYILKYYKDKNCQELITKEEALKLNQYYVCAYISETNNYNGVRSENAILIKNYIAPTNLNDLISLINEYELIDPKIYTLSSFNTFTSIMNECKREINLEPTEVEVVRLINKLKQAKDNLQINDLEKERRSLVNELKNLFNECKKIEYKNYYKVKWDNFNELIDEISPLIEDNSINDMSRDELNNYINTLSYAKTDLLTNSESVNITFIFMFAFIIVIFILFITAFMVKLKKTKNR